MKNFVKLAIAFALAAILLAPLAAAAEPALEIFDVDYDDSVAPGDTVVVDLTLRANSDVKEITITGELAGVKDTKSEIKLNKISSGNEREHLRLRVAVPNDITPGFHALALSAEGKSNGRVRSDLWTGTLEVEQREHAVWIKSAALSAESVVAGNSVDVAVRLLNNGKSAEDGVRVRAEVPALGLSQTVRLTDTLFQEDDLYTYLTLAVPKDTEAGIYDVKVTVSGSGFSATDSALLTIEDAPRPAPVLPARPIATSVTIQKMLRAGTGNVVDLSVSNNQPTARTLTLQLTGVADWTSSSRVDPNSLTLESGESKTVHVYVYPTASGAHSFSLTTKDGATTVSTTEGKVTVEAAVPAATGLSSLSVPKDGLVVVFVALIIVVAIAAAVWSMRRGQAGQTYY
jgi:uncharacterized membrane protein